MSLCDYRRTRLMNVKWGLSDMAVLTKTRPGGGDLVEAIRLKILFHELKPGESISEDALAEEFGVSRTPIREAILVLQTDRLVKLERNYGAYVAGNSLGAFKSYLEAATLIHGETCVLAAERRTERNISRMAELLEEAKAHPTPAEHRQRILVRRQFVFELTRASQNPLLAEQAQSMVDLHIFFRVGLTRSLASVQPNDLAAETFDDHHALLRLARERDTAGMRAAISQSFAATRQLMLRALA